MHNSTNPYRSGDLEADQEEKQAPSKHGGSKTELLVYGLLLILLFFVFVPLMLFVYPRYY